MNLQQLQEFCESKPQTEATFPFDADTLVYKVAGKMFALIPLEKWESGNPFINLKCDPDYAIELRETYRSITAGFHMSKKHWNSISLKDNDISPKLLAELINHSFDLVVKGLTKKVRVELDL
ncbi:MmcQ/YjbR family DNA-binding protein [Aurantibacter sp.]|uniref:MmcQ/YjbR family DNA-binding protein n=1 Tax=Aurantibacter sp. TaxID=2807103 RepID=UPI0035C80435